MPGHYNMPAIPNRYPLDKNDKLGLAIGALLSGGLAAANSNRNMGENPLLRGIAGSVAGFGGGANQIQDSYSKMLDDYLKGEGMDFKNREFGQKVKEFEEADKPEKLARARWYDEREATPVDYDKIRDERVKRELDIRAKQADLSKPIYAPGEEGRASFENINNLSGLPLEQLATIRKTPEYVAALNAFIKPNIMAEPYSPDLGGPAKTPTKGLWESIKDRFSTTSQPNIISKGTNEALSNRSVAQPSSIAEGTTGVDTSNNKKTIFRNGRWEYAD